MDQAVTAIKGFFTDDEMKDFTKSVRAVMKPKVEKKTSKVKLKANSKDVEKAFTRVFSG